MPRYVWGRYAPHVTRKVALSLLVGALILLPVVVRSSYLLSIMIFVGLYTILTTGLCLLMGYTGQASLGHAAFYGLGAYTSAIVTTRFGLSPWLGVVLAMALTGSVALLMARILFRLSGHYLAMATLGFGYIVYILFTEASELTGGPSGLTGIPYLAIGNWAFDRDAKVYYLVWTAAVGVLVLSFNLVRSRTGRALRAIHSSEVAAQAMSINVTLLKTQVFVLSASFAALAGSLYAHYLTFVNPSPFGFHFSVMLLVMASVGGTATVWGAPFGAALVVMLGELLREVVPKLVETLTGAMSHGGEFEFTAFGLLLVLVMQFTPEGIMPRLARIAAHLRLTHRAPMREPPEEDTGRRADHDVATAGGQAAASRQASDD